MGISAPRSEKAQPNAGNELKSGSDSGSGLMEKESASGRQIKKNKFPWLLVIVGAVFVGASLYFLVLKTEPKYTVTVTTDSGVTGTPATGSYTYKKTDVVTYSFTSQTGYKNLQVTLDGVAVDPSGKFKVTGNHALKATTTKIGSYTSVKIRCNVTFAGTNFSAEYTIGVDGLTVYDETLIFDVHSNNNTADAGKRILTDFIFTVTNHSSFIVKEEASVASLNKYWDSDPMWIWPTRYDLTVLSYTYEGGEDPGTPVFSENPFYLTIAPFTAAGATTSGEKTITIAIPTEPGKRKN